MKFLLFAAMLALPAVAQETPRQVAEKREQQWVELGRRDLATKHAADYRMIQLAERVAAFSALWNFVAQRPEDRQDFMEAWTAFTTELATGVYNPKTIQRLEDTWNRIDPVLAKVNDLRKAWRDLTKAEGWPRR